MKRVAIALVGLAALALAWLMAGFLPRELGRAPAVAPAGPPVPAVALRLAVLHTGQMRLHALQQAVPGLMILPAHDARAWERLAGQLQDPTG